MHGITPSLDLRNPGDARKVQTMATLTSTDTVLESQVLWYRYKTVVIVIAVLALLAGAAWGGYKLFAERKESIAAKALANAKTSSDYQKVIAQYPTTPAGATAYMFLAEDQRKEKKYSESNATLQAFLDKFPTHELRGTARLAMGANMESMGKNDEALALYQRLATDDPDSFVAPMAMMAQVPLLRAKNQQDEARRICETILTKYRDRLFSGEAQAKLRLLKPPTPAAAAAPQQPRNLSPEGVLQNLVPSLKMRAPIQPTGRPANAPGAAPQGDLQKGAPPPPKNP